MSRLQRRPWVDERWDDLQASTYADGATWLLTILETGAKLGTTRPHFGKHDNEILERVRMLRAKLHPEVAAEEKEKMREYQKAYPGTLRS